MSETTDESSRCLHCKNPMCRTGCPIGYDIPTFLEHAARGEADKAIETVGHIFGEICGYICPHEIQCKGSCILNKRGTPIDVGKVERQIFSEHFPQLRCESDALSSLRLAVVGGGVSGLTFAADCYRYGASVTVFERAELLYTLKSIPSFRLPRESIKRLIDAVCDSEINIVKKDISAEDLQVLSESFDAVYLATGVSIPHRLNIVGEEYVTLADSFLRGNSFGRAIVVGGGNTAMDCAVLNAVSGCETTVVYRRARADMPAFKKEIEHAEGEDVKFRFNLAPTSIEKNPDGELLVTFAETVTEGRGKLTITDKRVTLKCDILVSASGNVFDKRLFSCEKYLQIDGRGRVCKNIFAGGDATGKSLAAQAVADGLLAAETVKAELSERNKRNAEN